MNNSKVIPLIKQGEGFRAHAYYCTAGALTIGYGYNLDRNPLKLTEQEINKLRSYGITKTRASELLSQLLTDLEKQLQQRLIWWSKLNAARQAVLLDMAYNLGINGLLGFKKTLSLLERGEYDAAATEMLDSQWAKQVKTRAYRNSNIIRTGKVIA